MLRSAVLAIAVVLAVGGLGLRLAGHPSATPIAVWGSVLALAVLIERWRYRPKRGAPAGAGPHEWTRTDERFVDPETGELMEVFYDARTGEREYRATGSPLPSG